MRKIVLDVQGRKFCPSCKEYKELSQFHNENRRAFGVTSRCKICHGAATSKNYTLESARGYHLQRTYGLSLEEYEQMYRDQNGVCACCGQSETVRPGRTRRNQAKPVLQVDHCHTTGAVRGLLCTGCNTALGSLGEDPERVKSLLKYIEDRVLW